MFSTTFECFEGSKKGPAFCFKYAIFLWVTIQTLHKKRIKLSTQKMRMWTCTQKILLFFLSNYGNVASEQLVYLPKNACSYKHTHMYMCSQIRFMVAVNGLWRLFAFISVFYLWLHENIGTTTYDIPHSKTVDCEAWFTRLAKRFLPQFL